MSRRVGLRHMQSIRGKKRLVNPAFSYDNLVGAIWMEDPGHSGYEPRVNTGGVEIHEPIGVDATGTPDGGCYDNR